MSGFRLGHVGGVAIRAELSWLLVVVLVAVSMVARIVAVYDVGTAESVAVGIGAAAVFFACLLVHELAHATVARHLGLPVQDITLFVFGGATRTLGEHRSPGQELAVTVVGPMASLALAGLFALVVLVAGSTAGAVVGMIGYLAWVNLALGVFNLLPAYPMDGGRVLRALLWQYGGSRDRATADALSVAVVIAWCLIGLGVFGVVDGVGAGLWPALLGWFLLQSARAERWRLELRRELTRVRARDLVWGSPPVLREDLSVPDALDRTRSADVDAAFPVVDGGGRYVGLVTLAELVEAGTTPGPGRTVGELAGQIADGPAAEADAPGSRVLDELGGPDARVVVVVGTDRRVVGVVSPEDLEDWVRRRHGLDRRGGPGDDGSDTGRGEGRVDRSAR